MNITGFMVMLLCGSVIAADKLVNEFISPPVDSRAWCYWWWLNGNASKEGITRDFEEMRKQGISGALLFDAGEAGPDVPRGPKFMSDEWRELYKHAVKEADRCGIVLTVNLCSGWNAGGPWVTHEHAAKKLVSEGTFVRGPGRVSVSLPKPQAVQGFYRDIAVLACPVVENTLPGKLSASSQNQKYSPDLAEDEDDKSRWISNGDKPGMGPTPEKPEYLQFDLAEPVAAAGIYLKPYPDCGPKDVDVQCSDDGKTFRSLKRETLKPREAAIISFEETRAKCFRVLFLSAHPYNDGASWNVQVSEIALLTKGQLADREKKPVQRLWDHSRVVDVTKFMQESGRLDWEVPGGKWKVVRIGYTLHGNRVSCVGSGPGGLEIDPMSAAAMDAHFAETGAKLLADAGPLAGRTLQYFHIDSWEIGQPTWTPLMREEFQTRRGYDPLAWLPAVLGQIVDNVEGTARFMQDYRRTAADLVAANYYGRLEELSVKGGLRGSHPESAGPFFEHWIDPLECLGRTAVPMGEFWKRNSEPNGAITWNNNPSVRQAASAAHIYGKPVCQAEAYTCFANDWIENPWNMKDIGDAAFCDGLTRQVLCFWVHQARLDAKPGFQWASVGTHFDSNLTWWPMADGWLAYIARCQHLLRQGLFVADFACLQSEAIPAFLLFQGSGGSSMRPGQDLGVPAGFSYDAMNAEVLLTRVVAKGGRLVLPGGMSYRYLVLPNKPGAILMPATLKKINELADAGVPVIGPRQFAGAVPKMREGTMDSVAKSDGFPPDVEFRKPSGEARLEWIHRRTGDADLYFVSNQAATDLSIGIVFRVSGKQPHDNSPGKARVRPELWDAVTGEIRELPEYLKTDDGRIEVPLKFAPRQSWFVVFRGDGAKDQSPKSTGKKRNFGEFKPVMELTGPWDVQFDQNWFYPDNGTGGKMSFEQLVVWTKRTEDAIKYYSGIAAYHKVFDLPQSEIGRMKSEIHLALGVVQDLARVRLNGKELGTVWTAPWQVSVPGGLLKEKGNELIIEVANLWPNRLMGDASLPKEKRRTVTNTHVYDKQYADAQKAGKPVPLQPSGLLGPVKLMQEE